MSFEKKIRGSGKNISMLDFKKRVINRLNKIQNYILKFFV